MRITGIGGGRKLHLKINATNPSNALLSTGRRMRGRPNEAVLLLCLRVRRARFEFSSSGFGRPNPAERRRIPTARLCDVQCSRREIITTIGGKTCMWVDDLMFPGFFAIYQTTVTAVENPSYANNACTRMEPQKPIQERNSQMLQTQTCISSCRHQQLKMSTN